MIRPIMKDIVFLSQKSVPATEADQSVAQDLIDTLASHKAHCVGMAANMIGVNKNIIIVDMGIMPMIMFNPRITQKAQPFEAEESCLSLTGVRKTTRYKEIVVEYQDKSFKQQKQKFSGWIAQIIQHECDHLEGIII